MSISETVLTSLFVNSAGLSWPMRGLIGAVLGALIAITIPPLLSRSAEEKKPEQPPYNQTFNGPVTIGPGGAALNSGTINDTFTGLPERHISREQAQRFAAAAPGQGTPIGIRIQDGSNEARQYFNELASAFRNAGWDVRGQDAANTLPGNHKGLLIEVGDPVPKAVNTVTDGFDGAQIPYTIVRGPWAAGTPDAFRLTIWPSQ